MSGSPDSELRSRAPQDGGAGTAWVMFWGPG
jgi:hypothetical protein